MPAPFTKTVRGVAVPTVALGVFEEYRPKLYPSFAPDWRD